MIKDKPKANAIEILVFSTLYPHDGEPTLGVFVENRLRHLIKDKPVNATVIAPVPWFPFKGRIFGAYGRHACAKKIEHRHGLTVYHPRYLVIPKIGMLVAPYFLARSALRCINKLVNQGLKFDLIDAHYLFPDGVAAAYLAKTLNMPFVVTARGSDVTQIALMPKPREMIVSALRAAAHVITVSRSLKNKLINLGLHEQKITPLRNGVDVDTFRPSVDAKQKIITASGLNPAKPTVLFAGWLIQRKRVDIVIDMLAHLPDVQAMIVGDGPLLSHLKEQTHNTGVASRVCFCGQKPPDAMPDYFSAADILMLPSEREGWANVLLEAMACGSPVVSRAVDGACELVTNNVAGRLVEGDDPKEYALAVRALLNDMPKHSDVRAYARNFSWAETSEGQYRLFEKSIHDNPGNAESD